MSDRPEEIHFVSVPTCVLDEDSWRPEMELSKCVPDEPMDILQECMDWFRNQTHYAIFAPDWCLECNIPPG